MHSDTTWPQLLRIPALSAVYIQVSSHRWRPFNVSIFFSLGKFLESWPDFGSWILSIAKLQCWATGQTKGQTSSWPYSQSYGLLDMASDEQVSFFSLTDPCRWRTQCSMLVPIMQLLSVSAHAQEASQAGTPEGWVISSRQWQAGEKRVDISSKNSSAHLLDEDFHF